MKNFTLIAISTMGSGIVGVNFGLMIGGLLASLKNRDLQIRIDQLEYFIISTGYVLPSMDFDDEIKPYQGSSRNNQSSGLFKHLP